MIKTNFITFPLNRGKAPKVKQWQKLTESVSCGMAKKFGLLCGKLNNLTVVDVDVGGRGLEHWNELIQTHGDPGTFKVETPSGGLHYYFKHEPGLKNWTRAVKDANNCAVGIDIRTDGGFVVGFGSIINKKEYKIINDAEMAGMPMWLKQLIVSSNKPINPKAKTVESDNLSQINSAIKIFQEAYPEESKNHAEVAKEITDWGEGKYQISLRRLSSSMCDMCEEIHNSDNTRYLLICPSKEPSGVSCRKIFAGCFRNKQKKKIFLGRLNKKSCEESSQAEAKSPVQEPSGSLATMIGKAIKKITGESKSLAKTRLIKEFESVGCQVQEYEAKYCSDYPEITDHTQDTVIIGSKAKMGQGKTNAVASWALNHIKVNPEFRLGILSFRVSLTEQLRDDKYKEIPGIVSYRDTDPKTKKKIELTNSYPRQIIQPESLYRNRWTFGKNSAPMALIIDEPDAIRKQFNSETFTKQPSSQRSWKKFKQMVREAKYIYLMDANLNKSHIKWIKDIRNANYTEPIKVFWNMADKFKGRNIKICASEIDILRHAEQDLKNNKKVYIASNSSVLKIQTFAEILKKNNKKILSITRETLNKLEVKKALENPNDPIWGWSRYDAIICSPSVQSGVSFDQENVFDNIYGVFGNFTSTSYDCGQMLNRVRHPKNSEIVVSITMGNNNIGGTRRQDIVESLRAKNEHTNQINRNLSRLVDHEIGSEGFNNYVQNDYFKSWTSSQIEVNNNLKWFLWEFLRQHHHEGYTLEEFKYLTTTRSEFPENNESDREELMKTYRKTIKTVKEAIKLGKASEISKALDISEEAREALIKKINHSAMLSESESQSLQKATILKTYGISAEDLNAEIPGTKQPEWFNTYGDKTVQKHFKNQKQVIDAGSFESVLENLKSFEQEKEKSRVYAVNNPDHGLNAEERILDGAMGLVTTKNKYQNWKIILGWVESLGFESFISDPIKIDSDQMKRNLKKIHTAIKKKPSRYIKILGKDKRKMDALSELKSTDKKFIKSILKFVNGSIKGEFGVSVVKEKNKNKNSPYILKNKPLKDKFSSKLIRLKSLKIKEQEISKQDKSETFLPGDETSDGEDLGFGYDKINIEPDWQEVFESQTPHSRNAKSPKQKKVPQVLSQTEPELDWRKDPELIRMKEEVRVWQVANRKRLRKEFATCNSDSDSDSDYDF